ncbi:methyltransferase family protein [Nocardiopsis sp. Huas11]|uniref:class I SAM-dependent methyltransferase n=1 Tax=Nocardiopsis sp. Huas11 TaxID=2183912 RepID=UPI000EB3F01F|nr:class I SAM-dependent methyltransferase [Nocardiopsis sp. Huas11]RKS05114.1 methyltransferase family protein [Nocardiopsis sp. Huas11]
MGDRTQDFDRLTENYRRFRPGYPAPLLDRLREHVAGASRADRPEPWLLLDVGAGTGISTRAVREVFGPGPRVVGVEPGHAMRDTAAAGPGGVEFTDGRAEDLPFADGSAVLVLAAQAVHWFDRPSFYAEAVRVLAPGGTVAVLSNDRDWTASAFADAHETLLEEYGEGYRRDYRDFDTLGELAAQEGLAEATESTGRWVRELDLDGYLGMALSSTKMAAVVRAIGPERTRAALTELAERHFPDGVVRVPYLTRLRLARRT